MKATLKRLLAIGGCLALSFIAIHYTKARSPYYMPKVDYKVACIPAPKSKRAEDELDKKLKPYFHVAHTSKEPAGSAVPSYRCYFRFPLSDVACMPPHVALRNNKIRGCPLFMNTEETSCYFLDRKYGSLLQLLKRRPPVSKNVYQPKMVKDWRGIRDELLHIKGGKVEKIMGAAFQPGKRQRGSDYDLPPAKRQKQ